MAVYWFLSTIENLHWIFRLASHMLTIATGAFDSIARTSIVFVIFSALVPLDSSEQLAAL